MSYVLEASFAHDAGTRLLRTPRDITGFLTDLAGAGPDYRSATVYALDAATDLDPTHELVVGVDPDRGVGVLRYAGDEGEWFSRGNHTHPDEVVYTYFGTGHRFPADSEVPLDTLARAMEELLTRRGRRPECLTWQEWALQQRR